MTNKFQLSYFDRPSHKPMQTALCSHISKCCKQTMQLSIAFTKKRDGINDLNEINYRRVPPSACCVDLVTSLRNNNSHNHKA